MDLDNDPDHCQVSHQKSRSLIWKIMICAHLRPIPRCRLSGRPGVKDGRGKMSFFPRNLPFPPPQESRGAKCTRRRRRRKSRAWGHGCEGGGDAWNAANNKTTPLPSALNQPENAKTMGLWHPVTSSHISRVKPFRSRKTISSRERRFRNYVLRPNIIRKQRIEDTPRNGGGFPDRQVLLKIAESSSAFGLLG